MLKQKITLVNFGFAAIRGKMVMPGSNEESPARILHIEHADPAGGVIIDLCFDEAGWEIFKERVANDAMNPSPIAVAPAQALRELKRRPEMATRIRGR